MAMSAGKRSDPKDGNIFRINRKIFPFVPMGSYRVLSRSRYRQLLQQLTHFAHTHRPGHGKAFAKLHADHVAKLAGPGLHKFGEFQIR